MATTDLCDGDYLGAYRRFLEHFVANVCRDDQLPVKTSRRDVRLCEVVGEIADITLQHLNQRICPSSLQAYLVKLVIDEFKILFQKQPEKCGYRLEDNTFSSLKLMQAVTNKVNEICQRYLDNSRLALLPPPPSIPTPLASLHAIRNRRRKMEDRSVVLHDLHTMFSIKSDAVVNYYAVFDGHAGQEAATYCAAHLHQYLVESPYYPANIEVALRDAFQTTNNRFMECDDTKNSGATAVCALLYDKTLYIAWAGDSQAVLIKNGRGINLTIPHKPERPDEKLRIESLGGEVIFHGSWRVNGILNISRSLGDVKYKPFVSGEPEIKRIELDGTEDFLIVACDGFWDRATEEIVASLLYEYVCSSNCNYDLTSVALVNWAKQNLCEDNISVIVVFLTPPAEIAAKSFFNPRPVHCPSSMESGYQEQPPYDLDFGFGKQQQQQQQPQQPQPQQQQSLIQLQQTNGGDVGLAETCTASAILEPINGRHRPKPPRYNDDDDDDDDEEEEEEENDLEEEQEEDEDEEDEDEDVDLGPETNVDTVDDIPEEFGKLDQAMGQNYPAEFLVKMPAKREENDFSLEGIREHKSHRNELIPEADNVADSEDSEDEWNYYRPGDNKSGANAASVIGQSKDPALVEKPDQCEEEKELCSPKPFENNNLINQPVSSSSSSSSSSAEVDAEADGDAEADADAEADDVTAEYDELHKIANTKKRESEPELRQTDIEAAIIPEDIFSFVKEPQKQLEDHRYFEDNEYDDHEHEHEQKPQHLEEQEPQVEREPELEPREQSEIEAENSDVELEDMESHLNPNAAEFVPVSSTPPMISERMTEMSSDLIAGSPLKQFQHALKNSKIPSEQEFQNEICHRPSELDDDISDYSNSGSSPQKNLFEAFEAFKDEEPLPQDSSTAQLNLDESEISSTKAEYNDSTANYSVASELYKTSVYPIDSSYVGSDREDFNFSRDAMVTSMTPGDFKAVFEQELDLNKVHELNDEDLVTDLQNGTIHENDENMSVDDEDEFAREKVDLHLDNFDAQQQQQSAEVFSAIVEQKESDNKDLFMNMRNAEHDLLAQPKEERNLIDDAEHQLLAQPKEQRNLIDDAEHQLLAQPKEQCNFIDTAEHEPNVDRPAPISADVTPTYASNNPFAVDYVSVAEPEFDNQNLADGHDEIEEQLLPISNDEPTQKAPKPEIVQNNVFRDEVMQNPLDLNFEVSSVEQRSDEPVLVSPVNEPEVMTSKFAEENFISEAVEAMQRESNGAQHDEFSKIFGLARGASGPPAPSAPEINQQAKASQLDDLQTKSINLSESLQEFTGLEEQLSPTEALIQDNVNLEKSNIVEESPSHEQPQISQDALPEESRILKESLVDEQKDVKEVPPPSTTTETQLEEIPLITNETEIAAAATAASASASASAATDTTTTDQLMKETPNFAFPVSNGVSETAATVSAATAAAAVVAVAVGMSSTTAAASPDSATSTITVAADTATKVVAKPTTAAPKISKTPGASKAAATKSTTPTSPTKVSSLGSKTGTTSATAKKPSVSTTTRTKTTGGLTSKPFTATPTKTTAAAKLTSASKVTSTTSTITNAAGKTAAGRASLTASAPKPKPASTNVVGPRVSSTSSDKKPSTNGDVKGIGKTATASVPRTSGKPLLKTLDSAPKAAKTTRTTLIKTTSSVRAKTSATLPKPRPSTATPTTRPTSNGTARPKTAPTSTLSTTTAPKTKPVSTKSPMIDKQVKETANKQISSARTAAVDSTVAAAAAAAPKPRLSMTAPSKRVSVGVASPAKKPAPITKPGIKGTSNTTPKVGAKVPASSTIKSGVGAVTAKVVQNGVCEAEEIKMNANTMTTTTTTTTTTKTTVITNIEEDIPKKDVSPIEPLTDNQLITAE